MCFDEKKIEINAYKRSSKRSWKMHFMKKKNYAGTLKFFIPTNKHLIPFSSHIFCITSVNLSLWEHTGFHVSPTYQKPWLPYKHHERLTSRRAYPYPTPHPLYLLSACSLFNYSHASLPTTSLLTHDKTAQHQGHRETPVPRNLAPSRPWAFTTSTDPRSQTMNATHQASWHWGGCNQMPVEPGRQWKGAKLARRDWLGGAQKAGPSHGSTVVHSS